MNALHRTLRPGELVVVATQAFPIGHARNTAPEDIIPRVFRVRDGFGLRAETVGEAIYGEFVLALNGEESRDRLQGGTLCRYGTAELIRLGGEAWVTGELLRRSAELVGGHGR